VLRRTSNVFRSGWVTCTKQYFGELPILIADQKDHNELVLKVEELLEAKKVLAEVLTDKDKSYYENKCDTLDHQIDRLVYGLYGLTEDEIRIVEDSQKENSSRTLTPDPELELL
jgi:adenine-specific DNA-methyltransferase